MLREQSRQVRQETNFRVDRNYLQLLMTSREADKREGILFRQGRGFFCLPSAGHENMAAIAYVLKPTDYIFCHYRDRALMLARGSSLQSMALGYFAKKDSTSAGRQLSSHFSDAINNIVSCASPTASQCLPAAGTAWSMKMNGDDDITVCCVGEASIREGEFYEAFCFAVQENLPIVFVVEDNAYGISTPTQKMNPLLLSILDPHHIIKANGRVAEHVFSAMSKAADKARAGIGPSILWLTFDRLMSHTSSDDQKLYRPQAELASGKLNDPITVVRNHLYDIGELSNEEWNALEDATCEIVRNTYFEAEESDEPDYISMLRDVKDHSFKGRRDIDFLGKDGEKITYGKAVNKSLAHLLETNKKIVLFGQDIADPKGGVFGLTKGLSTKYPERVFNSPLAEATICGVAAGMAVAGKIPVFELQFIDFMATGFNQIANQIATMRWRTAGDFKCPLILLAPCGAYINGGGPWHTQTNEAIFAHIPGLNVYMPSNASDVADLIVNCANEENPSLILLPKQLFFKEFPLSSVTNLHPYQANIIKEGDNITLLAWGNCVELALEASELLLKENISSEVIDLKSFAPFDFATITQSLSKTGRIVVIHEDNKTCSFGQSVISQIVSTRDTWDMLYSPPVHVCRDDVLVPFNPQLAAAVMPSVDGIITAVKSIYPR